jgi:hypothetical protein
LVYRGAGNVAPAPVKLAVTIEVGVPLADGEGNVGDGVRVGEAVLVGEGEVTIGEVAG